MNETEPPATEHAVLDRSLHILGAPRSGTTLLGQTLRHHPDLAYASEPRLIWRYGNDGLSDVLRPQHATPEVVRYIRQAFTAEVKAQGRGRLLEKSPDNSLRVGFMDAVMPSPVFVHTVRHGLDSVFSIRDYWTRSGGSLKAVRWGKRLREMSLRQAPYYAGEVVKRLVPQRLRGKRQTWTWGPRVPGLAQMRRELDLLDVCCLQWRMCVEAACMDGRSLGPERYLELRLEDLSQDTLGRVLLFAGLDDAAAVRSAFTKRFRPHDAAARSRADRADASEVRRVMAWIEPTLAWLGYDH